MADWIAVAKECGFDEAAELDVATLKPMQMVRDSCATDKCHAYNHNWTCPPVCGTLDECAEKMRGFSHGILLQTIGHMQKTIDTKGYRETEKKHTQRLFAFAQRIRQDYPQCLCLGAGGCRICEKCAYPEPCRFPEKSMSSMEAYGLFVTQVCRDNHMQYYYGAKTITYTACVLYGSSQR